MHLVWDAVASHHHSAATHSLLVNGEDDAVCGDEAQFGIVAKYPVLHDARELVWVVAKDVMKRLWVVLVGFDESFQGSGSNADTFSCACHILQAAPIDGNSR